jgi:hypothetical protein
MTWLNVWQWMLDLGWFFFLLILWRHFWRERQMLMQAQSWVQVKGQITAYEWIKLGYSDWPKVEYSYPVQEQEMKGEYLFLDTAHNNPSSRYSRRIAYNVALAFKEGTEIIVYYNPYDPEQSALDVSVPSKLNIILIVIALLMLIHLGLMIWHHVA